MAPDSDTTKSNDSRPSEGSQGQSLPRLSLPKGGGAVHGIGEKFAANPVTGTGSLTVPIAASPGRSGFGPQLSLSYDSGSGNGPFGFGWSLSLPCITRKTDKGLPRYDDADAAEPDVFILSGSEDLVPVLDEAAEREPYSPRTLNGQTYDVRRYRPRIEGLFARVERWTNQHDPADVFWRSISRENITTWYGRTEDSRIADPLPDPAGRSRVFSWLICESRDDKGNAVRYAYKKEDSAGVDTSQAHERNRTPESRAANRHLKRILYGNRVSRLIQPDPPQPDWMFEVVFDYGEHDPDDPRPDDTGSWLCRSDPFSSYRAGFEVRTYRLCQRVLMFHHFPEEPEVGATCLVRSLDLAYRDDPRRGHPIASFIASATQSGYRRRTEGGYLKKSLPPLELEYSQATVNEDVREIPTADLENLPQGVDGTAYQWVDLDGEGLSGILTEQADTWFYKPSLGGGHFGPLAPVATKPSLANINGGQQQWLDLAGDGQLDLVELSGPTPGFFERTRDQGWERFRPFASRPDIDWQSPRLRFVDLNGDGHADVLITEDDVFTWYPSLAEEGFGPAQRALNPLDEEKGPRLVSADAAQAIYLADMSGDGLTDLVRVRNGEVCYWPNFGYGRFGAKVTMDDAPWFDAPDQFDHKRIRVADIDGSGNTDLIYLGRDGVRLYFNQSGNRWSRPRLLSQFPAIENLSSVATADLLGNGTACLVWSSPLPGVRRPMRYVALMEEKPHLLVCSRNNLGAETRVRYASSTRFYLEDKEAGRPWITRLPFPVHVVERVETYDRISRNRFVTRYAYHHGFFDGIEREFRGFGMVEQWDTEEIGTVSGDARPSQDANQDSNLDLASFVPPAHTKTWFHTGAYLESGEISLQFAHEYFGAPAPDVPHYDATLAAFLPTLLPDTILPPRLTAEEEREACRALKGSMLRQELYALDGSAKQDIPYTVTEQNFTVRCLQAKAESPHAVFFTHPLETLSYHYERNPTDPRIAHTLTLDVDKFGNVLKSASVGYGRCERILVTDEQGVAREIPNPGLGQLEARDRPNQTITLITYTENVFTDDIDAADAHRTPLPCETRTYELTSYTPSGLAGWFQASDFVEAEGDLWRHVYDTEIGYEKEPTTGRERRLIEHVRTYYRRDDLNGALPLGELQSLALPFKSMKLAFTPELLTKVYGGRVDDAMLANDGRYVHSEGDSNWWIPSGRVFYSPNTTDNAAEELLYARKQFFLPQRYRDPFHTDSLSTETFVTYDKHDLLLQETRDALGNRVTVGERNVDPTRPLVRHGQDYRVLQPALIMDPNRNRSAVAFDALGMVVATAAMGKPEDQPRHGDLLDGCEPDLTEAVILEHLAHPLADPHVILRQATTRLVYDLFAYWRTQALLAPEPAAVYALSRETHDADLLPGEKTKIQHSFSYSDGFGREIQKKIQAEPGPVPRRGADGKILVDATGQPEMTPDDLTPRWVGSGWTVFNNKGKPVRQYEPFFTDTHRFEFDVRIGVSPVLFYDPVERVVATLHPNDTYDKVVFDPWRQETWDVNDTVLEADPKNDPDVGGFFDRLAEAEYTPTWHALRTDPRYTAAASVRWPDAKTRDAEKSAADKAATHARTPTVAHFDTLGRTFLTVAHNRFERDGQTVDEKYAARVVLDIEGNQREVIDAKDRVVMLYDYDMLGNRIHQQSMEAGERWTLSDVVGEPLYAWDSRNHRFRTAYDPLRRPTASYLREADGPEQLVGRTVYGESRDNPETANLRGKVVEVSDQAGVVKSEDYDFKGNLLRGQRQLAQEYKATLDWSAPVLLEEPAYVTRTRYDALNRPIEITTPDQSGAYPTYNEANFLERVDVRLRGASSATPFVTDIDYDAKGQRTLIDYGNGVRTTYEYDPLTYRLIHLRTTRGNTALQDLSYAFDPTGNITSICDRAQADVYFNNQIVSASNDYAYDAIYRLIEATGREHLGQKDGVANAPTPPDALNGFHMRRDHPGDGRAMGVYVEQYVYDAASNFQQMIHRGSAPTHPGWTRTYAYDEPSLIQQELKNNRLSRTTIGETVEPCRYNGSAGQHGNITSMLHLPIMQWDFRDQLQATSQQVVSDGGTPETTWYVYDASGERVRKVTDWSAESGQTARRKSERIYLGGFEVYREYGGDAIQLERETLHVMDDKQRIALVETRTKSTDEAPEQLIRYQLGNHLGSASLELDDRAQIISYEEYFPYGSTSYQAVRNQTETPKRYRYTGKERDEESGFYYHGARYYASWVGRWTSCDPARHADGRKLYLSNEANPVRYIDPNGAQPVEAKKGIKDEMSRVLSEVQLSFERRQVATHMPTGTTLSGLDPRKPVHLNKSQKQTALGRVQSHVSQSIPRDIPGNMVLPEMASEEERLQVLGAMPQNRRKIDTDDYRVMCVPTALVGASLMAGGRQGLLSLIQATRSFLQQGLTSTDPSLNARATNAVAKLGTVEHALNTPRELRMQHLYELRNAVAEALSVHQIANNEPPVEEGGGDSATVRAFLQSNKAWTRLLADAGIVFGSYPGHLVAGVERGTGPKKGIVAIYEPGVRVTRSAANEEVRTSQVITSRKDPFNLFADYVNVMYWSHPSEYLKKP